MAESPLLLGRKRPVSPFRSVTPANVLEVLSTCLVTFSENKADEDYLINYKRGNQPILGRVKQVRPEINNTIVVNRANEIVSFKTGYLLSSPIQYVARDAQASPDDLSDFNAYVGLTDKESLDKRLAEDMSTCGVGYRMILSNPAFNADTTGDEPPFTVYGLDPRNAFVVYSADVSARPLMGVVVTAVADSGGSPVPLYTCYTDDYIYEISSGAVKSATPNTLGFIPVIEYENNNDRQGDFETVLPLLDAINKVESNRLDGVEQFIQSLLLFKNVDITDDDFEKLAKLGAIKIKQNGSYDVDVKFLTQEMNQTQAQTLADAMYQEVLTIVGMPNRNGSGRSTSDTGSAVIMRDGWSDAEARAKTTELSFRRSEKTFLRDALDIYRRKVLGERGRESRLSLKDIDIKFTRKNYENIGLKSQVLIGMLNCGKIAPQLAFDYCGMFSDPATAWKASRDYVESLGKEGEADEAEVGTGGDAGSAVGGA